MIIRPMTSIGDFNGSSRTTRIPAPPSAARADCAFVFGRGKHDGVRVIYYRRPAKNRVHLLTLYGKNVKDDLTSSERKAWRRVLEEIEHGST